MTTLDELHDLSHPLWENPEHEIWQQISRLQRRRLNQNANAIPDERDRDLAIMHEVIETALQLVCAAGSIGPGELRNHRFLHTFLMQCADEVLVVFADIIREEDEERLAEEKKHGKRRAAK